MTFVSPARCARWRLLGGGLGRGRRGLRGGRVAVVTLMPRRWRRRCARFLGRGLLRGRLLRCRLLLRSRVGFRGRRGGLVDGRSRHRVTRRMRTRRRRAGLRASLRNDRCVLSGTRVQRGRWPGEAARRSIGMRGMVRGDVRGARRTRSDEDERSKPRLSHHLPISHVPLAMCCACMRRSPWSFATSPPLATNVRRAPFGASDTVAFECTPIMPPA